MSGAEKLFENKIKAFLKENGCWYIKYWGGGQFTRTGVPDILACVYGHFVGIEVKSEKGTPSPLQLYNLRCIHDAGGFAILLYPDQFKIFKNMVLCLKANDMVNVGINYDLLKKRWLEWE
jgi:hypothetical protein